MTATFDSKVRAIITGSTGMVGEGVLHECLLSPDVEAVLVINRSPCGVVHPKLKEIILKDFFNFSAIETEVAGYNACFFCLGISSVGVSKEDYYKPIVANRLIAKQHLEIPHIGLSLPSKIF